jgi:TolB-like protein/Tfp pilus assembly protein PilF
MYTDMVGYTALGQRNESLSLALVEEQRKLIRPILSRHNGREVKTMGDAFLVEFPNASDSVRCAYDIQRAVREFNLALVSDKRIHLRIGIHLGEVVESRGDISGDAVNVASRIYPLAEDGGVCLTRQVYDHVMSKTELKMTSIGARTLKNVSTPIEVYKMEMPWEKSTPSEATTYPTNRLAILPFTSFSSNPDDAYFADGMTEEIISTVSGIGGLGVISRTSVMRYKGTSKSVKEIGNELEVGSVLEGSFRKAGNRIRVTAQLIKVADDQHLWAQSYDRNLDDIFEVQSDVAKQVADALRVKILSPERERIERKPTESTAAYTLYLRGRSIWNRRGLEDLKKAMEYFELAVKEDPNFALGYSGQADCAVLLAFDLGIDREKNLTKAKSMLGRALQLDPALAEAHTTMGMICYAEYDILGAEEEFKKAIELKPSYATAHQWYAFPLFAELKSDESLKEVEKAAELDPLSGVITENLGAYYWARKDFSKAAQKYKIALELGFEASHGPLADAYGGMKMFDQMDKEWEAYARYHQDAFPRIRTFTDSLSAYYKGDKETVRRLLPELETHLGETRATATDVARFHLFLGDVDKCFEWLERAYSKKEYVLLTIRSDWTMDGLRDDPRYLDLLKRLGLD